MSELGRFGHHPDPAIDFCTEVDALVGLAYEVEAALADRATALERIANAMTFTVGGDASAINAKSSLRKLEIRLNKHRPAEEVIRYEDAAEHLTNIKGWVCKKCRRYWGNDEHMARWCCTNDKPCPCGKRNTNKHYTVCQECRDRLEQERWNARPRVEWDGETPLVGCGDRFFFNTEDLENYLADEFEWPPTREQIDGLQLELCEECNPRRFELSSFLKDCLPIPGEFDPPANWEATEQGINTLIDAVRPLSWRAGKNVVTVESVMRHLGITE